MTSLDFKILPCELSDMSDCVDIFHEAFASDPIMAYLYPRCDLKALKKKSLKNYEKSYTAHGAKYFKAVHKETDKFVAFSKWEYPHTPNPVTEDPETAIHNEPQVPGSNEEIVLEFLTKCIRGRKKWIVPETHYFMSILAVRPEYQRKGLGSQLLSPVLELADKDKAKSFIQASPKGLGLYLKHGWTEVDDIMLDLSHYGGPKHVKTSLMIREPRSIDKNPTSPIRSASYNDLL
ncbi:hypothetical protein B7463_g11334, partial [Scytalidium lignicola]